MCLNKKVVAGLVAAAIAIYLIAPGSVGAALPLLLIAACPLSMLFMMRAMSGNRTPHTAESDPAGSSTSEDEVALLRAEVAELRNARDRRGPSLADPKTMGRTTPRSPE